MALLNKKVCFRVLVQSLAVLFVWAGVTLAPSAEPVTMEMGKVRLVNAIMKNTQWPNEDQLSEFVVGLFGRDPELYSEMEKQFAQISIRGKRVRPVKFESLFAARNAQVLILAQHRNDRLLDTNRLLRQSGTLIITDSHDDKRSVMVNFTHPSPTRLSFEINRSNIVYEGLKLSKEILLFGGTELDVAKLYKETEAQLQEAVNTAQKQQEELRAQQALLAKQEQEIANKERELKKLEQSLEGIKTNLSQSEQRLSDNAAELAEKESVLAEKEANINRYSEQIQQNQSLLTAQMQQLQTQERLIAEKNTVLSEQVSVIRNQQFILLAAGAVIILVILLITIIFRSYRAKQRTNLMLERKTEALQLTMKELNQAQEDLLASKELVANHLSSIAQFVSTLDFNQAYTPLTLTAKTGELSTDEKLESIVKGINETSNALVVDHKKLKQAEQDLNELNASLEMKVKHRTAQLEEANEKLVQMTEAKSQFLSTMSHEIRTPLNGVLGMVELLKDTPINAQQARYLDTIHTSGEVLLSVINDILDFSKIEAGKMPIESLDFDLEKLVFGCADIFSLRSTSQLSFVVDVPHDMTHQLKGDPTRIRQVVLNLLSNAFKFTDKGEIRLTAKEIEQDKNQRWYRISVSDTGTGLSEEQCANIFSAFAQADTTTTRRYGGTGLGLAISQRLAILMGGELSVESEQGLGSTFSLTLPLIESEKVTRPADLKLKGKKLLLVSPATEQLSLIAHAKSWGMLVDVSQGLTEARHAIAEKAPDILIMAEIVDGDSGLTAGKELLKLKNCPPILLFSNAASPVSPERITQAGLAGILELPLAPSRLREALVQRLHREPEPTAMEAAAQSDKESLYSNLKVLVAEDNLVNQMVIKGLLGKFGIKPELANNGLEAVAQYRSRCHIDDNPYDIILMDCEMPELDGLEATQQIREMENQNGGKHTPIVALTAHAMDEHRQKVLNAGMDAHLAKPLKPDALEAVLSEYCSVE